MNEEKHVSNCCQANIKLEYVTGYGTYNQYSCVKCKKYCDSIEAIKETILIHTVQVLAKTKVIYPLELIDFIKRRIIELEKENEDHNTNVTKNYMYHEAKIDENEIRIRECQHHLKLLKELT